MSSQQDDGHSEGSPGLQEHLSEVVQASKLTAKQRGSSVKPAVEALTSLSYDQGLLPADLNELIDLITTPSFLDQASLASIVRSLYPATTVGDEIVIKAVGCLGHGQLKPSLTIQGALLKWLIMIHHIMEKQDVLSQMYSVLFNLLDTAAIRPQLCHLLALITRRRHVRPHRIQTLLSLSRQTGNDPTLTGLLRVYKDYYPEIIVGEATRGKASAFKHPDPRWRERLDEIQQAHAQRATSRSERPLDSFRVARHRQNGKKGNLIPEVHTSHATEQSVTLEEIENVDGLVKKLETIELPNQLIAVLGDPLLQKVMLLRPQAEAQQRASNWLNSYAHDLMSGDAVNLVDILEALKAYVSATKTIPPVFFPFFNDYMKIWGGRDGKDLVLDILTYTPLLDFQELYSGIFKSLETSILDNTAKSQIDLLRFYTGLLQRWTIYLASLEDDASVPHSSSTIAALSTHVNDLCLTVLQTAPGIATHSEVLNFYEQAVIISSDPTLPMHTRIIIPPPPLVYILLFSGSAATVSRLCAVLAKYKDSLKEATKVPNADYPPEYVNKFNGFLMDIANCFWRSRAFNSKDQNAHGCLMPGPQVDHLSSYINSLNMGVSLESLFSLSYSPVLGLFAISCFRELEDAELERGSGELDTRHAGPVTRTSLRALAKKGGLRLDWDDYRLYVLDHLEENGLGGIKEILSKTMKTIMRRNSAQQE
ncbi:Uu.00g084960.m01.CDS01 [Anthostomella pinea]|uniref:Uu.00g084960.m01.CDS01 n=1 Tax=Anthostomella pinea TaxID=933095 RepID=A0AAI8VLU6_9PEZI|nr:Uu.00g084960.m01.CDS01 [Anthostomella pinea]